MTLLERIKELAKKQGYSLSKLNDQAGLGKNTIYSWKHKDPSVENLQKVAEVLHVSTDYLLGNTEDTSSSKNAVDLNDDDAFLTFDGRPIPEEDRELIKRLLRGK